MLETAIIVCGQVVKLEITLETKRYQEMKDNRNLKKMILGTQIPEMEIKMRCDSAKMKMILELQPTRL